MKKPILCLDFDGVIHSYASGWKGAANIPDAPVPGALQFIVEALEGFEVHILSSRSHQWGGRRAMKKWLRAHLIASDPAPQWWFDYICAQSMMEPWDVTVRDCADTIVSSIKWPFFKPPAMVTIDDRALTFDGTWPAFDRIRAFQPWNKTRPTAEPLTRPTAREAQG